MRGSLARETQRGARTQSSAGAGPRGSCLCAGTAQAGLASTPDGEGKAAEQRAAHLPGHAAPHSARSGASPARSAKHAHGKSRACRHRELHKPAAAAEAHARSSRGREGRERSWCVCTGSRAAPPSSVISSRFAGPTIPMTRCELPRAARVPVHRACAGAARSRGVAPARLPCPAALPRLSKALAALRPDGERAARAARAARVVPATDSTTARRVHTARGARHARGPASAARRAGRGCALLLARRPCSLTPRCAAAERPPVWLMRQAGRYMAAFRECVR